MVWPDLKGVSWFWNESKVSGIAQIGLSGLKWFESVLVNRGDVVFMSYYTLHRTGIDGFKNNVRIAVSTRYDNADEATFVRRGFPTAYGRLVNRNLVDESFPSDDDIINIFK